MIFQAQIVLQKYDCHLKKLLDGWKSPRSCCVTLNFAYPLLEAQMIKFCSFQAQISKYYIPFDLEMLHGFWKKLKKINLLERNQKIFKSFLMFTLLLKNYLAYLKKRNVLNIALLVKYQTTRNTFIVSTKQNITWDTLIVNWNLSSAIKCKYM